MKSVSITINVFKFNSNPRQGTCIFNTYNKRSSQNLTESWWFSLGTVISSTNKNIEDITEILLKVALNSPNWKK